MKQLIFVVLLTIVGSFGALVHPFYGVLLYYTFALLQPQDLWRWALPEDIRWSAIAAIAAIGATLLAVPRLMGHIRWNVVASLILVFAALTGISAMNAMDTEVAGWWGTLMTKVLVMTLIASLVIHEASHLRMMMWMVLIVLGYLAWEINFMYFAQGGRLDIIRHGHGGLDNNALGLLLAMGLPFAYAGYRVSSHIAVKAGCAFVAVLIIHAVLMSFSRMSMLCGIAGCVWLLFHHRPRWQVLVLVCVGVMLVSVLAGPEIRARFLSINDYDTDGSAQSRFDSWAAAWKITWDHPITGVGIRNSNLLSHTYGADVYGRTIHNQYLQLSADLGLPAMVVYVAMCGLTLWRTARVRWACHTGPDDPALEVPDSPAQERRALAHYALAIQTSMIMFCIGAFFLSLEVFELSWLLIVLGGVLPHVADRVLNPAAPDAADAAEPDVVTALPSTA